MRGSPVLSYGSTNVTVQVNDDWFVLTLLVVSEFELVFDPTDAPFVSVQLIEVARVASLPFGRSASGWNVTVACESGVLPKSRLPTTPPELAVTAWPNAPGVIVPPCVCPAQFAPDVGKDCTQPGLPDTVSQTV